MTILTFWLSTVFSELLGSQAAVVAVKLAIPWGFLLLIPALATTVATGFRMTRAPSRGLVSAKIRRMPFIGANGLLVLIPSALYLAAKADEGVFDAVFVTVQAVELTAGAINIVLLGLNMRDGLKLGRRRAARQ
ncbi:hypothetical protein [Azorhizobium oxalatiphilum]|nr:hypothetical protein [Azorhizobium oxalatiphilum]